MPAWSSIPALFQVLGARIEVGISANFIAEGTASKRSSLPVVATIGAVQGLRLIPNNDGSSTVPLAGDWSGIFARHLSSLSIDSSYIAFGGGSSSVAGDLRHSTPSRFTKLRPVSLIPFWRTTPMEPVQTVQTGAIIEAQTDASVIHVVASQPIILDNVIRNNAGAAISIDANAMKAVSVRDYGRQTGLNNRSRENVGNLGPFVVDNRLGGKHGQRDANPRRDVDHRNGLGRYRYRSRFNERNRRSRFPYFRRDGTSQQRGRKFGRQARGGNRRHHCLRTPARYSESDRWFTAGRRRSRFPVVLTSLSDDTIGAGFDWEGRAMLDTNNNAGRSQPVEGDWRSLRLNPYSNDRNLDTIFEIEADPVGDTNRNDLPSAAQNMGALADNLNGGDETLRLGFSVRGTIAAPSDLDVYRFRPSPVRPFGWTSIAPVQHSIRLSS